MKQFVAIVGSEDNKVAKYQDFDTIKEAQAHVAKYGGFVATGLGSLTEYWVINEQNQTASYDQAAEDADIAAKAAVVYKDDRKREYPPIGDQLDAIWKELNLDRMGGKNLNQDADDMLNMILATKAKYHKPE
tara:strand:+ start:5281 stop:5676 length:396 start_codon:yes stop_codon:yes gene_type:complete